MKLGGHFGTGRLSGLTRRYECEVGRIDIYDMCYLLCLQCAVLFDCVLAEAGDVKEGPGFVNVLDFSENAWKVLSW